MPVETPARRIDDTGEKIGGARKDYAKRALDMTDFAGMTETERATLVVKDHVWPAPDYAALIAGGMEPKAAALVKILRDRLSTKPNVRYGRTPLEAAEGYVTMMGLIRDACLAAKSVQDVKAVNEQILARFGGWRLARLDKANIQIIFSITPSSTLPLTISYSELRKADIMLEQGFPGVIPSYRSGVTVKRRSDGTILLLRGLRILVEDKTLEGAWATLETMVTATKTKKAEARETALVDPKAPHLERVTRLGPVVRDGHVSPQDFLDTFGFRGVEFGNWLPDSERQEVIDLAYEACHDLAWALGFAPQALSLDGTLAIAFGARGNGGKANAHYEAGRCVINATRLNGAGLLAHEFGHALDHWLGLQGHEQPLEGMGPRFASGYHTLIEAPTPKQLRSANLPLLPTSLGAGIDRLMNRFVQTPKTLEEYRQFIDTRYQEMTEKLERATTNLTQSRSRPISARSSITLKWEREMEQFLSVLTRRIERTSLLLAQSDTAPPAQFGTRESHFLTQAKALCGPSGEYWARPTELFARSFHAFVFDTLKAAGRQSDYLAYSAEGDRFPTPPYKGNPFPVGQERAALNAAYDAIIQEVRAMRPLWAPQAAPARPAAAPDPHKERIATPPLIVPNGAKPLQLHMF